AYSAVLLPMTMMIVFTSKMMWVWHTMVDFTRLGARYATTHCWQGSGSNVSDWMRQNVPLTDDRDQFVNGPAQIEVTYFSRNVDTGAIEDFTCDLGECTQACIPDLVRVRITGYEFRQFFGFLGLPPVALPDFQTTMPMESAGCNPDSTDCL